MYTPAWPRARMRKLASASSVTTSVFQPPISSSALRRMRPIVPAKMIALRCARDGMVMSKKYR